MTPINNPRNGHEEKCNRSHCRTRNKAERAFGLLKTRSRHSIYNIHVHFHKINLKVFFFVFYEIGRSLIYLSCYYRRQNYYLRKAKEAAQCP